MNDGRCQACGRVACACADETPLYVLMRHARAAWWLVPAYRDGLLTDPRTRLSMHDRARPGAVDGS